MFFFVLEVAVDEPGGRGRCFAGPHMVKHQQAVLVDTVPFEVVDGEVLMGVEVLRGHRQHNQEKRRMGSGAVFELGCNRRDKNGRSCIWNIKPKHPSNDTG